MDFIIFDTEKRFKEFMKHDEKEPILVKEMYLINKKNFWFETKFNKGSYLLSMNNRYVHINPNVTKLKGLYDIKSSIRLTPQNFKYNYKAANLKIYSKFWFWNRVIKTKVCRTHYMKYTDKELSIGKMYWYEDTDKIYCIID